MHAARAIVPVNFSLTEEKASYILFDSGATGRCSCSETLTPLDTEPS